MKVMGNFMKIHELSLYAANGFEQQIYLVALPVKELSFTVKGSLSKLWSGRQTGVGPTRYLLSYGFLTSTKPGLYKKYAANVQTKATRVKLAAKGKKKSISSMPQASRHTAIDIIAFLANRDDVFNSLEIDHNTNIKTAIPIEQPML